MELKLQSGCEGFATLVAQIIGVLTIVLAVLSVAHDMEHKVPSRHEGFATLVAQIIGVLTIVLMNGCCGLRCWESGLGGRRRSGGGGGLSR
jgi:hypothetical protein